MSSTSSSLPPSSPSASPSPLPPTFPPEFLTFLTANHLSPSHYTSLLLHSLSNPSPHSNTPTVPSRFVHPTSPSPLLPRPTPTQIAQSLNIPLDSVKLVSWLPLSSSSSSFLEFYRLPGSTPISPSPLYQNGQLQALDAASAVAVHALSLHQDDNVLDLCCAPGGKLALCAEAVKGGRGTVTGVDLSETRMFLTRKLLGKVAGVGGGGKTRLFVCDGRRFDLGVGRLSKEWRGKEYGEGVEKEKSRDEEEDREWGGWERGPAVEARDGEGEGKGGTEIKVLSVPTRFEKSARGGKEALETERVFVPYDKVLVDAECSHDGSMIHLLKYLTLTPSDSSTNTPASFNFPPALLASLLSSIPPPASNPTSHPTQTVSFSPLQTLQLSLLLSGFRLLRPVTGILVYSTCSLSIQQGEIVVQRFLDLVNGELGGKGPRAVLEEVEGREKMPCLERDETLLGGKAVRFGGGLVEGKEEEWVSGLFVCRLRKIW